MNRASSEVARRSQLRRPPARTPASVSHDLVMQRWLTLREMLIRQLDMFERGGLTLHSNDADISSSAVADLKASILDFDALIAAEARPSGRP